MLSIIPLIVAYSELSYFEGYHYAHIAAYQEHLRIKRLNKQAAAAREERCRQARLYAFYSSSS